MAFTFQAAGWSEFNQPDDVYWYEPSKEDQERANENDPENPFAPLPSDLDPRNVEGIWVHAYDFDDPDNEHWFWVRTYMQLDSWEQWDDLITLTIGMHSQGWSD